MSLCVMTDARPPRSLVFQTAVMLAFWALFSLFFASQGYIGSVISGYSTVPFWRFLLPAAYEWGI